MDARIPTQVYLSVQQEGKEPRNMAYQVFLTEGQASRLKLALQEQVESVRAEL